MTMPYTADTYREIVAELLNRHYQLPLTDVTEEHHLLEGRESGVFPFQLVNYRVYLRDDLLVQCCRLLKRDDEREAISTIALNACSAP
jgi:hypothetical protein